MIWTQWVFIGLALAIVGLVGFVVCRNPQRFITKIYTNPLVVYFMLAAAVIVFAWFAGNHTFLEKAAFGLGSLLAIKYLGIAANFAEMFNPKRGEMVTRLDLNMVLMVLYSLAILAGLMSFIGIAQFADAAVESLAGAFGAAGLIVGEIYMNKERRSGP